MFVHLLNSIFEESWKYEHARHIWIGFNNCEARGWTQLIQLSCSTVEGPEI